MSLMPLTDAMFLVTESREQPMHVGAMSLFEMPDGAGSEYLAEVYRTLTDVKQVSPAFRRRPHRSIGSLGQWTWQEDPDIDLEHHIRHSALPQPYRIRELLALVSRLHGTPLDRQRPLWEFHLIEGLKNGRFATYTKLHHALMDGVTASKLLIRQLSESPDDPPKPPIYAQQPSRKKDGGSGGGFNPLALPGTALHAAREVAGIAPSAVRVGFRALQKQQAVLPVRAPRSMFNVAITGSRRFAAQSWPLERFREIAKATGTTVNDVLLAVCAGALRAYLIDQDALPSSPLIAMTPVSLRGESDPALQGNAVGAVLCNLATTTEDPADRLAAIHESMRVGKAALSGLSQVEATAISAIVMSPLVLSTLIEPYAPTLPPYNLVISNVPGPREHLYYNGAKLVGSYPLSIPTHGQALNITVSSYADELHFGLVGCRRSVPRLQRLLADLDNSLNELQKAVGA